MLNDVEIRRMEEEDFTAILELVDEFAEDSLEEYGMVLDRDKQLKVLAAVMATSFVLLKEEKLVGVLAGEIVTDTCSNLPCFQEVLWYVKKGRRKYGVKLFKFVQQWCIVHGIKRMTASCMWNSKTQKLFTLYKKMGFVPLETRFMKVL